MDDMTIVLDNIRYEQDGTIDTTATWSEFISILDALGASWEDYCTVGQDLFNEGQRLAALEAERGESNEG